MRDDPVYCFSLEFISVIKAKYKISHGCERSVIFIICCNMLMGLIH